MPTRKRTAEVTVDAYGRGTEDVRTQSFNHSRWAGLFAVEVSSDNDVSGVTQVDVRNLDVDDDDAETDGESIFHGYALRHGVAYHPRLESSTDSVAVGLANSGMSGEENALPRIKTSNVRVDVEGATALSTVTVDLYIDTAGDQRF